MYTSCMSSSFSAAVTKQKYKRMQEFWAAINFGRLDGLVVTMAISLLLHDYLLGVAKKC